MAASFVRMTISIPAEVRERMDRCPKSVNWSAVAAEAFSAEADRHNPKPKGRMMIAKTEVARLRKSLEEAETESYRDGRRDGFRWAAEHAEARQLQRLRRYWMSTEDVGPTDAIAAAALGGEDVAQVEVDEFWERALGDDWANLLEDTDYILGFVGGATEAWEQAESQL